MKKNMLLFLYMSLLIMLPHCAMNTKKKKQQTIKTYKYVRGFRRHTIIKAEEYRAKLDGVECPFCAESAVALVKKIDGVVEAFYQQSVEGKYEDGVLVFMRDIKKGDIARSKIEEILQEEEFILDSLERASEKTV